MTSGPGLLVEKTLERQLMLGVDGENDVELEKVLDEEGLVGKTPKKMRRMEMEEEVKRWRRWTVMKQWRK